MPAKKVVSRENLIEAALGIVRKEGMDGLNMRTLAKACNCSTQPIYLSFSGADQLKSEVRKRIVGVYRSYREREIARKAYPDFKAAGMAYIRFAKEESEFFKCLFMNERTEEMDSEFKNETAILSKLYNIENDSAIQLHVHMWIWVHGIATMFATGYHDWDRELVSKMLTDAFLGIKERLGI